MKNSPSFNINGKHLYYAFVAGSNQILHYQQEINLINVFPVSDKDTGTNLASTVRSVMENIQPNRSYKATLEKIANEALIGARGNSGIIFAQFLHGLNMETANKPTITFFDFIESLRKSIPILYEAIANPIEGTMLSIIKDWSAFLNSQKDTFDDLVDVFRKSLDILENSLVDTTSKLKILRQHNVVDAGAKGFVVFILGIFDFIKNGDIRTLKIDNKAPLSIVHSEDMEDGEILHRYCTEAIIKNLNIPKNEFQNLLSQNGDSVVIAGSKKMHRLHVHTNHPAELFHQLKEYGTLTYQKVDDMIRQNEVVKNRKWKIALVTDSTCDLSQTLIDHYQINVVPINLNFGENYYLDKVTIQPDQFYDLLKTSKDFPKTSQINERTFTNTYSHLASHYDAIIALHLSSAFSGTFANSKKAAERIQKEFNKPIFVIDSKTLSGALGLLVLKAAHLIEKGEQADQIAKSLEAEKLNAKIYVSVRNLESMIKGGRVSKPKGYLAKSLGLNPVISMDENGKSLLFGKTFSQKASLKKIFAHIEKLKKTNPVWNYVLLHAHNPEEVQEVKTKMLEITDKEPISVVDISPVIGMHAGNGALAISLIFNS